MGRRDGTIAQKLIFIEMAQKWAVPYNDLPLGTLGENKLKP